jgi:diacylglycerol kinase family enzyme
VTPALAEEIAARLRRAFDLEVSTTGRRLHATELARDAVARGAAAVITFSGDGTVNEVVNALAGEQVPLGILPGGATNVLSRHLGYPSDLIAATEELVVRARRGAVRAMPVGRINDRFYSIAAGAGLDAAAMRRAEARPELKRRLGPTWLLWCVLATLARDYVFGRPRRFRVSVDGGAPFEALFALASHMDPATYFRGAGLRLTPEAGPDTDLVSFTRFPPAQIPALAWSIFRTGRHAGYPNVRYARKIGRAVIEGDRPFPIQVDGDYVGVVSHAEIVVEGRLYRVIA